MTGILECPRRHPARTLVPSARDAAAGWRVIARSVVAIAITIPALLLASPSASAQDGPWFSIETLNPGLPAPDEALDRSTPRATMEALIDAAQSGEWGRAAQLMDLASIPEDEQASVGPMRASELFQIIDRKVMVDFTDLPDRPDAMDTRGSSRDPMVGEPRKSLLLGSLELERYPVSLRLNRVKPADSNPVWVISRQTVEHVPALYERFGPTQLERELPEELRQKPFWGLMWWELIAFPVILLATAALGLLLWRAASRAAEVSHWKGATLAIRRARLPLVLFICGLFLQWAITSLFVFSAPVEATVSTLFWLLIVMALVFGATRVLDTLMDYTSNRYLSRIDDPANTEARRWYTNLSAAKRVGTICVLILGLALALSSLNVFSSFGLSLLVSAGVATAVFGLAAQTILGNILASLQLAFAKPIRIGDAVYYQDHWCYVEKINYTYVQLRTWDQKRFVVPVRHFVSTPFENWTKDDPQLIMPVLLKLDHRTDVEAVRKEFARLASEDEGWAEGAEPKVQVIGHDEDGMDVRLYCTAPDPTAAWNLHCRMREKMLAFLRDEQDVVLPRIRIAAAPDTRDGDAAIPLDRQSDRSAA